MLEINDLIFRWPGAADATLNIPKLEVAAGERVFLHGPSGSGKSTLLGLLSGINKPEAGSIRLLNSDLAQLSDAARDKFRADHIGTIFQNFNLLPYLSPVENVMLGCHFSRSRTDRIKTSGKTLAQQAELLLQELGLDASIMSRSVAQLSIGQQQRVAAARAFIGQPELIIADEPTSALDADNRNTFIELLFKEASQYGATILFVSHDSSLAPLFDKHLSLVELNGASQ
ncbi:putative ABC transport system ATP-binding protein [Pseudoalteromonas rubra]|uniref:ATP-binding cassette domain-containing protein n=1 Tax=Pseudoalteromonas rubra TaxID=43658 RepID=A0A5S3V2N5_9GAMM|nr:ABC transporter ATP-binding protein [Pseudoalteromonas rubra]KAF7788650.1 putative ABC transport system ATP-binding protein [Pseudoalteromonas rubra]QPB81898.1 ATP-binding cassette domain-containing protein [Pseudoalteromonas rubra]